MVSTVNTSMYGAGKHMWSLSAAVCAEKLAQQSPAKVGCSRRKTVKRGKGTNGTLPREGTEHFVRTVHTGKHHALTSPRPPIGFIQVRPASVSVRHNTLREYQGLRSRRPGRYKSTGPFCFCGLVLGRFLSGCRTLHHNGPIPEILHYHVTERERVRVREAGREKSTRQQCCAPSWSGQARQRPLNKTKHLWTSARSSSRPLCKCFSPR